MSEKGDHILSRFDDELEGFRELAARMGALALSQLETAISALVACDPRLAARVLRRERRLNQYDMQGQEEGVNLLARHQPLASDLRFIVYLSRTISDLERIGDQAKAMAAIVVQEMDRPVPPVDCEIFNDVRDLGEEAVAMLTEVLGALARDDVGRAVAVVQQESRLDQRFQGAVRRLATFMLQDPRNIRWVIDALLGLKVLERVGDHANNIAENLIFAITAKDVRYIQPEHLAEGYLDDT